MPSSRTSSPELQIARLAKKHAKLDAQCEEMSTRSYLTPHEQVKHLQLKKKKLTVKDELERWKAVGT